MQSHPVSRRDFHKLSAAALGGLIAGAALGCSDQTTKPTAKTSPGAPPETTPTTTTAETAPPKASPAADKAHAKDAAVVTVALHACRGLNECKGLGKSQKNACAGQGDCYTVKHECGGQNDCKFQGGCGGEHGTNDCKGKGGCGHFPIPGEAWKKARVAFEAREKTAGKKVGPAPQPAAKS